MKKFLSIFFLLLVFSCAKDSSIIEITGNSQFPDDLFRQCFWSQTREGEEFVIRDNEQLLQLADTFRQASYGADCDTAQLPSIDFDKYTLIFMQTNGGGCSADFDRKVFKDEENKNIIYEISVTYQGLCEMYITNKNWALVPKVPDDYSVVFKLVESVNQ